MFYHLFYPLSESFFAFNIFRYITFRAAFGFLTAFLMVIVLGKFFIRYLKRMRIAEHIDMSCETAPCGGFMRYV